MSTSGFGVSVWPGEACLVTELAAELAALPEDELRRAEVVLPTKRLANWLLALLAARKGAFVPPRLHNFDGFVSAHAAPLGDPRDGWAVAGDLEQELLLAGLLKETPHRHLRLGHEHEIKQLFAELVEWGLGGSAFTALRDCLRQDVFRSELALDTLSERVDELERLHAAAAERLEALANETKAARSARQSAALASALEADTDAGRFRGPVYLVGFTSIGGLHRRLLAALARHPQVAVWVSAPPDLYGERNPIGLVLEALGQAARPRTPAARALVEPAARRITVHAAPTALDEVAEALRLAEAAIQGGCPPSLVAILVTSDAVYGKPLRTLLRGKGIEANLAIGTPLASTSLGAWLRAFVETAVHGTVGALLALASHPISLAWRQATAAADEAGAGERFSPQRLKEELAQDLCHAATIDDALAGNTLRPTARRYAASLMDLARPFSPRRAEPRPLAAWARDFAALLAVVTAHAPESAGGDDADFGVAKSAVEACTAFCSALERAAAFTAAPLTAGELMALVREKLLGLDVRSVGDQLCGVQVLSVAEARYVPFALTIVLGCAEGSFPRALPKDHLVDNFLKSRIGLPGWQLLEAIEDTTFHLLRARLPRLALLHPRRRGTDPVVRSRFVESLLSAGEAEEVPVGGDGETLIGYLHKSASPADAAARIDLAARRATKGAYAGERAALHATMSATALEQLVRCPYRFLLSRLGVRDTPLPDATDVRAEGDFLHGVLEAFFTGKVAGQPVVEPLAQVPRDGFRAYALARLGKLTAQLAPPALRDTPLMLQLELRSWPAFVDHLMRLYAGDTLGRMTRGFRELAIGDGAPHAAALDIAGAPVRIAGSVDSVDRLADGVHVLTDYKRGSPPDRAQVRQGLAPQLLLYAAALDRLESRLEAEPAPRLALANAVAGYWSILRGEWMLAAAGSAALTRAKALGLASARESQTLEELTDGLLARWTERSRALFGEAGGAFAPDDAHCGFCRFAGICRRDEEAAPA